MNYVLVIDNVGYASGAFVVDGDIKKGNIITVYTKDKQVRKRVRVVSIESGQHEYDSIIRCEEVEQNAGSI